MILPKFPKNCIKLKEFVPGGGRGKASKILLCRSATKTTENFDEILLLMSLMWCKMSLVCVEYWLISNETNRRTCVHLKNLFA